MLVGTSYYTFGATSGNSYPGFFAFGNNPYASNALAQSVYGTSYTAPGQSYIQFGKFVRPISSGFLQATAYYPYRQYDPPYGAAANVPGQFLSYGNVDFAIGSHALNTLQYVNLVNLSAYKTTFFK